MKNQNSQKALIKKAVEEAAKEFADSNPKNSISNYNFTGVQWDAKAVDAVHQIACALAKNAESQKATAEGLKTLAEVLKSSNVSLECMLRFEGA